MLVNTLCSTDHNLWPAEANKSDHLCLSKQHSYFFIHPRLGSSAVLA